MKSTFAVCALLLVAACGQQSNVSDAGKIEGGLKTAEQKQAEAVMADMIARQKLIADSAAKYGKEEVKSK